MTAKLDLNLIRTASPCDVGWDNMRGDDKARFCEQCHKFVYNFAAMTWDEGVALIKQTEGRLCGHVSRRRDGTIITADCPVGLAEKLRHRRRQLVLGFVSVIILVLSLLFARSGTRGKSPIVDTIYSWLDEVAHWLGFSHPARTLSTMDGLICPPPTPPSGTPAATSSNSLQP